ncbi:YggS family pyridoxal phosphate enzyme [Bacteroidia bacterium]|nr:YggS family pyridoxal phosphate enzyme [Bacteroidia bacterium]
MSIASRLDELKKELPDDVRLTAVSKFQTIPLIGEAYAAGQRIFGESRVQELVPKQEQLPKDIEWHFIGHLQQNKVKYIAPFIDTVQSVDSRPLLQELNKQAERNNRIIKVLLQVHIAQEPQKFGFSFEEITAFFKNKPHENLPHLRITGLMGMATQTEDKQQIRAEFSVLATLFFKLKKEYFAENTDFRDLSMGMSDDYLIAIEEGSTIVRIGSKIFGERNY